jgi:hypothetical protein
MLQTKNTGVFFLGGGVRVKKELVAFSHTLVKSEIKKEIGKTWRESEKERE